MRARVEDMSAEETQRWLTQNGIDAQGVVATDMQGLMGFEMTALRIASDRWETITRAEIEQELNDAKVGNATLMVLKGKMIPIPAFGDLPATYLFKTREAGTGILQIVGFTEEPRGMILGFPTPRSERLRILTAPRSNG